MKRIPGLVSGILFFLASCCLAGPTAELASELFEEGDYLGCDRECRRVLSVAPEDQLARLLAAVVELRLRPGDAAAAAFPRELLNAADARVQSAAHFEMGLMWWRSGNPSAAASHLATAVETASSPPAGALASRCLWLVIRRLPPDSVLATAWRDRLNDQRSVWTAAVTEAAEGLMGPVRGHELAGPGRAIVAFYRRFVGPAIGARCSLEPSCSRYFLESCERHGLLGFPLIADRLVREPGVVQAAASPVRRNGGVRYADPVSAHDGWLGGGGLKGPSRHPDREGDSR